MRRSRQPRRPKAASQNRFPPPASGTTKKYGFSFFPPFRLSFSHAGEKLKRVTIKVRYIDKTYRFAYLETPMRSEIHAAVPLWINTPLEPPLPSGSPSPSVGACAEASSPVGGAAGRGNRDHERGRLLRGGTGPYLRGVGFRMPADNALTYSLRSGQSSMVLTPGKEEVCRTCSGKGPARMWPISRGRW